MGDVESEQSQDDFEVEVADIGELDAAANSSKPLYPSPRPRFSPRQRRLQLIVTIGIVVLSALVILVSAAPVRELVGGVFIRPTPSLTPTMVPGADLFYVRPNPPWGHLSIDGHTVARLPIMTVDPPLHLSRGQHVLVWRADPFLTQRCTVTVPGRFTDTCVYHETVQLGADLFAWIITFSISLATLSDEQRTILIQAVQVALDARQSTDTVQPGELYALTPDNPACRSAPNRSQCYATTNQPLKATLSFRLDTNEASNETCIDIQPGNCTLNYQDCRLFCGGSFLASSSTREWDVFAPVLSLWTFATMDGRVLARDVPDNSPGDYNSGQLVDESLVSLSITWDSLGWHVTVPVDLNNQNSGYFNPACAATQDEVASGLLNPPVDANGEPLYVQWQLASGTIPAPGCVAVGIPQPNPGTTPSPSSSQPEVIYCLHRFGVLLAANDLAQRSWPFLPLADAYEQQLAQQLAARIGGYFRVNATVVSSPGSP